MAPGLSNRLKALDELQKELNSNRSISSTNPSGNGSVRGYIADEDDPPPSQINLRFKKESKRRMHSNGDVGEDVARKKRLETEFNASNARNDLTSMGLPCPTLKLTCSHVKLLKSKNVVSSPFLAPIEESSQEVFQNFSANLVDTYSQLYEVCRPAYQIPISSAYKGTTDDSEENAAEASETTSNSSVTMGDIETSDENRDDKRRPLKQLLEIGARLDDSLGTKGNGKISQKQQSLNDVTTTTATNSLALSIEEAFELLSSARVVTLSSPPYTVVHANAAFLRKTGVSSISKPFFKLTQESSSSEEQEKLSLAHFATSTAKGRDLEVNLLCQKALSGISANDSPDNNKDNSYSRKSHKSNDACTNRPKRRDTSSSIITCPVRVFPVVSGCRTCNQEEIKTITHYAVDVLTEDFSHVVG